MANEMASSNPFSQPRTLEDWRNMALAYAFVADELRRELDTQLGLKRALKRATFNIIVKIMRKLG